MPENDATPPTETSTPGTPSDTLCPPAWSRLAAMESQGSKIHLHRSRETPTEFPTDFPADFPAGFAPKS
jgi:hypothetical protein